MDNNRVYGPTFPDVDTSDTCTNPTISEHDINQYKHDLSICQTVGPLLPGYEVLDEVRHISTAKNENNADASKHVSSAWMSEKLPPSQVNPLKNLKSRGFSMNSGSYLDFSNPQTARKSDERESLMQIHKRNLMKEKEKTSDMSDSSDSSIERKSKKKLKKHKSKRHSESTKNREKKSKKKRSRSRSDERSEKKTKKSKKDKSDKKANLGFKWSPFDMKTKREAFNRDTEMTAAGAMSSSAKAQLIKQAHSMAEDFVTSRK